MWNSRTIACLEERERWFAGIAFIVPASSLTILCVAPIVFITRFPVEEKRKASLIGRYLEATSIYISVPTLLWSRTSCSRQALPGVWWERNENPTVDCHPVDVACCAVFR